jgi:hypothetical protein
MSKTNDRRDMLIALLLDMNAEPPQPVDISTMDGPDKVFALITCCLEMIAAGIRLMAATRDEAMEGVEAAADDLRDRMTIKYGRSLN